MDRRHQVFVSSTFDDLREERAAVISALLQIDCFPAGMELFPASDEDSWSLIKRVIDDSDYYVVVLAGRYGSVPEDGTKSFTQMEYEYAVEVGKPTIALLHSNPGSLASDKSEQSDDGRKRLEGFREVLKKKHCRFWADKGELTSAVFMGVQQLKKTRPENGWVRGSDSSGEALKDELLRAHRQIETLSNALDVVRADAEPEGTQSLAQGHDETILHIIPDEGPNDAMIRLAIRWDDVIGSVLPHTFGGGTEERTIRQALVGLMTERAIEAGQWDNTGFSHRRPIIPTKDIGKVLNQMVALGLIDAKPHATDFDKTIWVATPFGQRQGCRMIAERRPGATPVP